MSADPHRQIARVLAEEWPDPAPLADSLPAVEEFDPDFLPPSLRPLVCDTSELMQAPPDYAAAASIVSLAGAVNRRATVFPKVHDTSWSLPLNLWGCVIAPPGMMKSPIQTAITRPLARIEDRWRTVFEDESELFRLENERHELLHEVWKQKFKQAAKKGDVSPVEQQPGTPKPPPVERRLLLTDSTYEKLHKVLAENPAGVLVVRDELTGWLSTLDREGRQGERGFYLQAWNGEGGFIVDRMERGTVHVPNVCVSLLGNIQPTRLRWYLTQTREGGQADDGLMQRFQIATWPDPPKTWKLVDRPPNLAAVETASRVFSTLAELSANEPLELRFAADAQALFFEW